MPLDNKGPGGIKNSYGTRTTTSPAKLTSTSPKDVYNGYDASAAAIVVSDPLTGEIRLNAGDADIGLFTQASLLSKPSKGQLNYAEPTKVFGYTAATGVLDKAYQRYSNYTLRVDFSANSSQIRAGTAGVTADPVDQLLSIDVYIPFMPSGGASGNSINVLVANTNGFSSNNLTFGFDSGYLRQGWNSLRMWAGDTNGASGAGTLAFGAIKTLNGTGCDFLQTIGYVEITFQNFNGRSVYLDGVRRGAKTKPVLVMGFDATGVSTNDNVFTDKVAPLFESYGYQGYFTVTDIYDMLYAGSADDARKRTLYARYGWDALNHTWNHGGTVPGGTATVTGSAAADVVTITRTAHSYPIGSKWHSAISGATPSAANGVWEMTATTVNAFTYTAAGAGTGALTGTITNSTLLADVVPSPSTLSTQIVNHELIDMAKVMRGTGFNRAASIGAWPNNSVPDLTTTQNACNHADAQIKLFRGIKGGTVKINEFGVDNPLHFGSVEWGNGATATTLQFVKDKLAGAIGRGEHMWTYGHYVLDDTDPANAAFFPVDNGLPPGSGGNPAAPSGGTGGGGWWYLSTINRFFAEAVAPAVAAGTLEVKHPSDWASKIGVPLV